MARKIDFNKSLLIRQDKDDQGQTRVKIIIEGTASDPDATNDFDRGPLPLRSYGEIDYDPSMTLLELSVLAITKLKEKAGVS